MKDTYLSAKFIDFKHIELVVFTDAIKEHIKYELIIDGENKINLVPNKKIGYGLTTILNFELKDEIILGHVYEISLLGYATINIDTNDLALLDEFDEKFYYDGELGAIIKDNKTTFSIWAPLAYKVILKLCFNGVNSLYETKRNDKGVYEISFDKNLDGAIYTYIISNSNRTLECIDPYAFGSTQNAKESVVIDFNKININFYDECRKPFNKNTDAIIYEGHVKDLTNSKNTDIVHKGKFLGLIEENRKTKLGNPAGFDYIKSLGITHLQLLPILDFASVDEINTETKYNWGYDPAQFFALEGSYASKLEDPYSRILDFMNVVSKFHKDGLRINLDVVYNHVYEYNSSNFEKVVPNYYFRRKPNGKIADSSGCGNDLCSERRMVKKLIIDSAIFLIKIYHIDGLRFDIMGLIDAETLQIIETKAKQIRPDIILYGEGWDIYNLNKVPYATINNNYLLKNYGFFNDRIRDILKGNTFKIDEKGYLLGNSSYREGMKFAYLGCVNDITYPRLFDNANQALNYVECHDNMTLFDKINHFYKDDELDIVLERVRLINSIILFSFGIPFIHAGQEIGQTKFNRDNTYKDNDRVNDFNYDLVDERYDMVKNFILSTKIRNKLDFLKLTSYDDIHSMVNFINIGECGLLIDFINKEKIKPFNDFKIFINPSENETIYYDLEKEYLVFASSLGGDISHKNMCVKNLMIKPISYIILFTK